MLRCIAIEPRGAHQGLWDHALRTVALVGRQALQWPQRTLNASLQSKGLPLTRAMLPASMPASLCVNVPQTHRACADAYQDGYFLIQDASPYPAGSPHDTAWKAGEKDGPPRDLFD